MAKNLRSTRRRHRSRASVSGSVGGNRRQLERHRSQFSCLGFVSSRLGTRLLQRLEARSRQHQRRLDFRHARRRLEARLARFSLWFGRWRLVSSHDQLGSCAHQVHAARARSGRPLRRSVVCGARHRVRCRLLAARLSHSRGVWWHYSQRGRSPQHAGDSAAAPARLPEAARRRARQAPQAQGALLESPFFDNNYIKVCLFLENLAIKDAYERDSFFKSLPTFCAELPQSCRRYKLLPELLKSVEFAGAGNWHLLAALLNVADQLPDDEYGVRIAPVIVRYFECNDRALRIALLQNMNLFIDKLSTAIVNDKLFPPILSGFADSSAQLRELTVKSMLARRAQALANHSRHARAQAVRQTAGRPRAGHSHQHHDLSRSHCAQFDTGHARQSARSRVCARAA
jgi:hypothetical protein